MPKLKHKVPSYRLHKRSGQAVVTLNSHDHHLGPYGTQASRDAYERLLAERFAMGHLTDATREAVADLTVVELVESYIEHARVYYRKPDGRTTSEFTTLIQALKPLNRLCGTKSAASFGPRAIKAVREAMIRQGWCRSYINKQVSRIKTMFRWASENELVPPAVYHGLLAVRGMAKGRCKAPESKPVRPVPTPHIEAIQPYVSEQVWALIQLQLLTGARPGELVAMRSADVDLSGRAWIYRCSDHKTAHYGRQRSVCLGPKAQQVIQAFLRDRPGGAFLFSPAEEEAARQARIHANRKTPLSCGNQPGTNRTKEPRRRPGDRYTVDSYRRAIARACKKAGVPRWHPHQLRHNAATFLRKEFGIDAARVILGHTSPATTEIYAELDHAKAIEIMSKVG